MDQVIEMERKNIFLKIWPKPKSVKLDNNTCTVCLEKPDTYRSFDSFKAKPVMFDHIKKYGNSVMHKKIRGMEFLWKGSEKKEKRMSERSIDNIRQDWQNKFKEANGACFFGALSN